ncbi:hypothetical protein BDA99DRAFT_554852 [Phascolomyces articulosus]|uniref:Uncharacterized protein n=1 Tax=Phascolomyces articulosus TaxID=60185 RepID=A0AAD5KVU1_9FUNG|nr:hypothetical protein BDA99DRAFT_554852 [Phascolomyces articulosus]
MSYYHSMYNNPYGGYGGYGGMGYNNPYMYGGGYGAYGGPSSYMYGGGGYGAYGGSYYPSYSGYYGGRYRGPGLFRSILNRIRYGSSSYYGSPYSPTLGMYDSYGRRHYPGEMNYVSSVKDLWKSNDVY